MRRIERLALLMAVALARCCVEGKPQALVLTTTTTTTTTEPPAAPAGGAPPLPLRRAFIDKLHVRSDIQFRYSRTQVKSYVKNPEARAQYVEFDVLLPEKAFISNFTVETGGETYVAQVKEKQEAREAFDTALTSGSSAGLVDARDENVFSVKTNVAAEQKLVFTLTYEQLLERHLSRYEQTVYVDPRQIVDDLRIDVYINESLPIVDINVPQIKQSSNDIVELLEPNSVAVTKGANTSQVHVSYHPTVEEQKRVNADKGVTGQFIVQYDVDRRGQASEVQIVDGYFVHFFSPEDLPVIPKHVVFVLDVSGSMQFRKLDQLKDSMVTILDDLGDEDFFSILTFSSAVHHWTPAVQELPESEHRLPIHRGSKELRKEAISYVLGLEAQGSTNIYEALSEAVKVANQTAEGLGEEAVTPLVVFLTDGRPSIGTLTEGLERHLETINEGVNVPVYGLAFGSLADFNLIKSFSQGSGAFARKIYEASDAAIQLEDFYKEISSPLLTNVTFQYVGKSPTDQATNVLPGTTFHKGSEYVTVGKVDEDFVDVPEIVVQALSADGPYEDRVPWCSLMPPMALDGNTSMCLNPPRPSPRSANFIERLWAKMTIDRLLDGNKGKLSNKTEEEFRTAKALALALEYNFVTDLTSLVVVTPFEKDDEKNGTAKDPKVIICTFEPYPSQDDPPGGLFRTKSAAGPNLRHVPNILAGKRGSQYPYSSNRMGQSQPQAAHPSVVQTFSSFSSPAIVMHDYGPLATTTVATTTTTTTTTCPPVDTCQLVLYSKTYLRGDKVVVKEPKEEFADPIGDSATSLEVIGPCSWTLFSEPQFGGNFMDFYENKYKSAVSMGSLFRNIKSIKRNHCSQ